MTTSLEDHILASLGSLQASLGTEEYRHKFGWIADTGSFERWLQWELGWQISKTQYVNREGTYWVFPERRALKSHPDHPFDLPIFLEGGKNRALQGVIELKIFNNTRKSIGETAQSGVLASLIKDIKILQDVENPGFICVGFVYKEYWNEATAFRGVPDIDSLRGVEDRVKQQIDEAIAEDDAISASIKWLGQDGTVTLINRQDDRGEGYWKNLGVSVQVARVG